MEYVIDYLNKNYITLVLACGLILMYFLLGGYKLRNRKVLLPIAVIVIVLSVVSYFDLNMKHIGLSFTWGASIVNYGLNPLLPLLVIFLLDRNIHRKERIILLTLFAINLLIYISSPLTHLGMYFLWDEVHGSAEFHRGPLNYSSLFIGIIYDLILIYKTARKFASRKFRAAIAAAFVTFSTINATVIDAAGLLKTYDNQLFLPVITASVTLYFLFLFAQDAARHEEEKDLLLNAKQQELMLTQIRPHFLYNTLGAIRYLVKADPDKAMETINDFSTYLRNNMNAVNMREPIPFYKEIEHIKTYLRIEMLRFENFTVEYELDDMDFVLPALSIQPIVENAVKHGVRGKQNGLITLRSYFENDIHTVVVTDNGEGFDPENAEYHVGIRNVEERLKGMVGGSLIIESAPEQGTKVSIFVPEDVF